MANNNVKATLENLVKKYKKELQTITTDLMTDDAMELCCYNQAKYQIEKAIDDLNEILKTL